MKLSKINKIIKNYLLETREDIVNFISNNPENLAVNELSLIAEKVNNSRTETAAYYTDETILELIQNSLPDICKDEIRILEPSVGVGNFVETIVQKYKHHQKVTLDLIDIDSYSLDILKLLLKMMDIPRNIHINIYNEDFLTFESIDDYDLVIGNPPFLKLKQKDYSDLNDELKDGVTKNLAGLFLKKSCLISKYVCLILPKYFLNNTDFAVVRKETERVSVKEILDFGEKGFKGVLIETIFIVLDTESEPAGTKVKSITFEIENVISQKKMTDKKFPYWLLYRNDFFDQLADRMNFNIFKVFRDRQITNSKLSNSEGIWVIKSRNIKRDGSGVIHIDKYDSYLSKELAETVAVNKYIDEKVFLAPNMTYYPRVIRKPENTLVNGSVAILINDSSFDITDDDLAFLSSYEFEKFYRIARNYSTRSLNIDKNSVFFFGKLK